MSIYKAYLRCILNHKSIFVAFFISTTIIIVLFTLSANQGNIAHELDRYTYAYLDSDHTELSGHLGDFLRTKGKEKEMDSNEESIVNALFFGEVQSVLKVPKGFEQEFAGHQLKIQKSEAPGVWAGFYIDRNINSYLNTARRYRKAFPNQSADEVHRMVLDDLDDPIDVHILQKDEELYALIGYRLFYNMIAYVLVYEILSGITIVTASFNAPAIKNRIRTSAISGPRYHSGLLAGHITFTLIVLAMPILLSWLIFPKMSFTIIGGYAVLRVIVHALTIVCLSFLISAFVTNIEVVSLMANAISLPLCFFGGIFVPSEFLGDSIKKFSQFLPQYWYAESIRTITQANLSAKDIAYFWQSIRIELLIAAALLGLALVVRRQKRMTDI